MATEANWYGFHGQHGHEGLLQVSATAAFDDGADVTLSVSPSEPQLAVRVVGLEGTRTDAALTTATPTFSRGALTGFTIGDASGNPSVLDVKLGLNHWLEALHTPALAGQSHSLGTGAIALTETAEPSATSWEGGTVIQQRTWWPIEFEPGADCVITLQRPAAGSITITVYYWEEGQRLPPA